MKEYTEYIKKDTKVKVILVWVLLIILIVLVIINLIQNDIISAVVSGTMLIIIFFVYLWIKKEGKRKVKNVEKMFKKKS